PLLVLGLHGLFGAAAGLVGWDRPLLGLVGTLFVAASLVGEGTGRLGLLRLWLAKSPSANLVIPPTSGGELGTVVISAPLDQPRLRPSPRRGLRRPLAAVAASLAVQSMLLVLRLLSEPFGRPLGMAYGVAVAVLAAASGAFWLARRTPDDPIAEAGGPAAVLELQRRLASEPLPGVAVWWLFTGCGHAHQDGMAVFLSRRGDRLPRPLLVLTLDGVSRPPLAAALSEGPLWPQSHRATGPALVERLRWSGVQIASVDHPEPTDARPALLAGHRALALVGGRGPGTPEAAVSAVDRIEALLRLHAGDLARVSRPSSVPRTAPTPPLGA
ncbi:MAG: hypothetical protein RLZZ383_2608, partial [Pseudomonadota bacterium]